MLHKYSKNRAPVSNPHIAMKLTLGQSLSLCIPYLSLICEDTVEEGTTLYATLSSLDAEQDKTALNALRTENRHI